MRYSFMFFAVAVALLLFGGGCFTGAAVAQTAKTVMPKPMTKGALRQQDRQECSKQVGRTHANLFLQCLADRRIARKLAAKKK